MQFDFINLSRVQRRPMNSTWEMSFRCSLIKSWVIMSGKETDIEKAAGTNQNQKKYFIHAARQRHIYLSLHSRKTNDKIANSVFGAKQALINILYITMKVEWIYVIRQGMWRDGTFFQVMVRNMQCITWWHSDARRQIRCQTLEMCCVFKSWQLGTHDRLEKVQNLRAPDYHPIPIHPVKHCDFMILASGYIPQFKFLQYSGGEMVARAGKSVGWARVAAPVCCLRHDLLYPCAKGLRELAMELHCLGGYFTSPLSEQKTESIWTGIQQAFVKQRPWPLSPPPTTKPSELPPALTQSTHYVPGTLPSISQGSTHFILSKPAAVVPKLYCTWEESKNASA